MDSSHTNAGVRVLTAHRRRQTGVTSIEYALIASLIAVVIVGAVSATGANVSSLYNHVAAKVSCALSKTCP